MDQQSVDGITVVVAALAGALVVVALVLLVLWRRARRAARRNEFDRTAADRERLDLLNLEATLIGHAPPGSPVDLGYEGGGRR